MNSPLKLHSLFQTKPILVIIKKNCWLEFWIKAVYGDRLLYDFYMSNCMFSYETFSHDHNWLWKYIFTSNVVFMLHYLPYSFSISLRTPLKDTVCIQTRSDKLWTDAHEILQKKITNRKMRVIVINGLTCCFTESTKHLDIVTSSFNF